MNDVQRVKAGQFSHAWMTVIAEDADNRLEFKMSADGLRFDGLLGIFTPVELEQVFKLLGAVAPTAALLDLRARQASTKTLPVTLWPKYQGAAMGSNAAIKEHTAGVDAQVDEQGNGVSVYGKHYTHPLELERLYGWHVEADASTWRGIKLYPSVSGIQGLKTIQPHSSFHQGPNRNVVDGYHEDYAMTFCAVQALCRVNGELTNTLRVYNDPAYQRLVWGTEKRQAVRLELHEPWRLPDATVAGRRLVWAGYQWGLKVREVRGSVHNPRITDYSKHCRRGGQFIGVRDDGKPIWSGGLPLPLPRDEDPWCAAFASGGLLACLYPGEVPPHGLRVAVRELAEDARANGRLRLAGQGYDPRRGDLALLGRSGHNPLRGGPGHVRMFVQHLDSHTYQGIGGNESDAIGWGPHKYDQVLAWVDCQ